MKRFIFALLLAAVSATAAETVELKFAPADGTVWESRFESERRVRTGDKDRTDSSSSDTRHVIAKTDSGYEVSTTTTGSSMKSNGYEISNPMMRASEGVELDYIIGADGKCTDVRGYDRVLASLKTTLPGPFFQQMAPLFNAAGLKTRDMRMWNERIGRPAGTTATIGDVWVEVETMALPQGGAQPFFTATVVEGWADCGDERCLKLKYVSNDDEAALVKALGANGGSKATTALEALEERPEAGGSATITGGGERLFDPATMRIHS